MNREDFWQEYYNYAFFKSERKTPRHKELEKKLAELFVIDNSDLNFSDQGSIHRRFVVWFSANGKMCHHQKMKTGLERIQVYFSDNTFIAFQQSKHYIPTILNDLNKNIDSKYSVIKFLIPSKRREEILGDLMETEFQMIADDIAPWKIRMTLYFHAILIVISLLRVRISDYGPSKKIDNS